MGINTVLVFAHTRSWYNGWKQGGGRCLRPAAVVLACALAAVSCGCFVAPDPLSEAEHWRRSTGDVDQLFSNQVEPAGPISLAEAVARAVKYNLDHRLAKMEESFHRGQLDVSNLGMLPRFALNAGYSIRDSESASSSIAYDTGQESLVPSYSSERRRYTGDLSFSWSLLDFGLSYFQAKQQADRFLILKERRRRIMNNLIKDVITDYFRVATADRMAPQVEDTLRKAEKALETYKKLEESKTAPLAQTLEQQRAIVNIISHLRLISVQAAAARSRLAALMNLPLGSDYQVVVPGDGELLPPVLSAELPALEAVGIYLRPDLREEAYQGRIDQTEVRKDILRMVPGMSVFGSGNYDSNKYLVNQSWVEAGARATLDLVGMAAKYKQVKSSKAQVEVARARRLATTLAALVQINMSYFQYRQAVDLFQDSEKLFDIENKLLDLSSASARAREVGELEQVRQSALTLNARLERDRSLMEVFAAWGNLYFSVGGDILMGVTGAEDLCELSSVASYSLTNWLSGGLPPLPDEAPQLPDGCLAVCGGGAYASIPAVLAEVPAGVYAEPASDGGPASATEKDGAAARRVAKARSTPQKPTPEQRVTEEREAAIRDTRKMATVMNTRRSPSKPKTD